MLDFSSSVSLSFSQSVIYYKAFRYLTRIVEYVCMYVCMCLVDMFYSLLVVFFFSTNKPTRVSSSLMGYPIHIALC